MAQPEEPITIEEPPAPSSRVEGWVQYYEYFHKLNDDMQRTAEALAQRRASPSGSGPPPPPPKRDAACFELIAAAIKKHDKPLVQIEDSSDGSAKLGEQPEAVPGSRRLTDDDLALVRAQLRAAAQATNAQEQEDEQRQAAAAEFAAAAAHGRRNGGKDAAPATANTCAAAIETLLWFGEALGDKEKKEKEGKRRRSRKGSSEQSSLVGCFGGIEGIEDGQLSDGDLSSDDYLSENGSLATVVLRGVDGLGDLSEWDWEQAMREAGMDEDAEAPSTSSSRPLTPQELSSALLEEGQREEDEARGAEQQHDGAAAAPADSEPKAGGEQKAGQSTRRAVPALSVKVQGQGEVALARFDSASEGSAPSDGAPSDGAPSEAGEGVGDEARQGGECDDAHSVVSGEGEGGDECDADGGSSGRTTPRLGYSSPDSSARSAATRRSQREPKPHRPWLSAMPAPLLKWEKEQQQSKPGRPKRRAGGRLGEGRGDEVGFETDSGEDLHQLLSPNELLSEAAIEQLGIGQLVDLSLSVPPKRQRC